MVRHSKIPKKKKKTHWQLNDMENEFLSIILMNENRMEGPKLKRIFLERYSLWDMQKTEKNLLEKGFLIKNCGAETGEALEYSVPTKYIDIFRKTYSSKEKITKSKEKLESISMPCCGEYSILWYLWQLDSIIGFDLFSTKKHRLKKMGLRKAEEQLSMDFKSIKFLQEMLINLSNGKYLAQNGYKKWADILDSPHKLMKEVFNISYGILREKGGLGKEDVGKDNMDFLLDELASLAKGKWYPLESFVTNAKNILFSCNQSYRWIHFDLEGVWNVMNDKLRLLGILDTSFNKNRKRYFMITTMGGYCLGSIPENRIMKILSAKRGRFMVHPNFEITVVSKELNPKILLELAMFSEPAKIDTMSVFKVTKETVKGGIHLGLTTEEMVSFLMENSKGKVPQNVEYSIRDWGK